MKNMKSLIGDVIYVVCSAAVALIIAHSVDRIGLKMVIIIAVYIPMLGALLISKRIQKIEAGLKELKNRISPSTNSSDTNKAE